MARQARKQVPIVETRGKAISVQFFADEDVLIRDLAQLDGNRPVADTVRVLALAEARRRSAQGERAGVAS
jgi:hypothetical protein